MTDKESPFGKIFLHPKVIEALKKRGMATSNMIPTIPCPVENDEQGKDRTRTPDGMGKQE